MPNGRLKLALCWHMHQPYYREGTDGAYVLPWVYLHGIKDYSDMAAHLEQHPQMHLTVNFAPVLLEQIDDYAAELQAYLANDAALHDPMLGLLAGSVPIPSSLEGRIKLIQDCQRCHAPRMIEPYPAYAALTALGNQAIVEEEKGYAGQLRYLGDQYFIDLLVWYHWSWLGYSLKQSPPAQQLTTKGWGFDLNDRRQLLTILHDCLGGLIPRYRALAERGQIELSMTPYGHPIIPLLNDFGNMRCAQPHAPAPEAPCYPDGAARADWHMREGLAVFKKHFGFEPKGVWLSEGGISEDAVELLQRHAIHWTASGEGVWRHSHHQTHISPGDIEARRSLFKPNRLPGSEVDIFFRDDGLSDLIGFEYSNWSAGDAVADLTKHLVNIADFLGDDAEHYVVSVILDGENAWEYYPDNGYHFLSGLYAELSAHPRIEPMRLDDARRAVRNTSLESLCAGSWVYGTFSTWIGHEEKNRAWDLLVAAKHCYDQIMKGEPTTPPLAASQREQIEHQLAICEGSDWFWWFGDHNPAGSVSDFDRLYRLQLRKLYLLLGVEPPDTLNAPLSRGGGQAENAGTMRKSS